MSTPIDEALRQSVLFRRLKPDDRERVAAVAIVRAFEKGAMLFSEGDGSDLMYTVLTGRVKVFKTTPRGTDVILSDVNLRTQRYCSAVTGGDALAAIAAADPACRPGGC